MQQVKLLFVSTALTAMVALSGCAEQGIAAESVARSSAGAPASVAASNEFAPAAGKDKPGKDDKGGKGNGARAEDKGGKGNKNGAATGGEAKGGPAKDNRGRGNGNAGVGQGNGRGNAAATPEPRGFGAWWRAFRDRLPGNTPAAKTGGWQLGRFKDAFPFAYPPGWAVSERGDASLASGEWQGREFVFQMTRTARVEAESLEAWVTDDLRQAGAADVDVEYAQAGQRAGCRGHGHSGPRLRVPRSLRLPMDRESGGEQPAPGAGRRFAGAGLGLRPVGLERLRRHLSCAPWRRPGCAGKDARPDPHARDRSSDRCPNPHAHRHAGRPRRRLAADALLQCLLVCLSGRVEHGSPWRHRAPAGRLSGQRVRRGPGLGARCAGERTGAVGAGGSRGPGREHGRARGSITSPQGNDTQIALVSGVRMQGYQCPVVRMYVVGDNTAAGGQRGIHRHRRAGERPGLRHAGARKPGVPDGAAGLIARPIDRYAILTMTGNTK